MNSFADMLAQAKNTVTALTENHYIETALPVEDVYASEQIRKRFDGDGSTIAELAESIKRDGQFHRITVRQMPDGRYEIIFGERRYRAIVFAGLPTVDVRIVEADDETVKRMQLAENVQRLNFSQGEIADRLAVQLEECGGSLAKLVEQTQKSKSWLSKMLSLRKINAEDTPHTAQLIKDNVTADVEILTAVRRLEEDAPDEAAAVVAELADSKGQTEARKVVRDAAQRAKDKKPRPAAKLADETEAKPTAEIEDDEFSRLDDAAFGSLCMREFAAHDFSGKRVRESLGEPSWRRLNKVLEAAYQGGVSDLSSPVLAIVRYLAARGGIPHELARLEFTAFCSGVIGGKRGLFNIDRIITFAAG